MKLITTIACSLAVAGSIAGAASANAAPLGAPTSAGPIFSQVQNDRCMNIGPARFRWSNPQWAACSMSGSNANTGVATPAN